MSENIIAIATYRLHRVKHPHTRQTVSAYKLGYTSAASTVLLALYGERAQDVSSQQASYHYVQIDAGVTIRRGYILLKVSEAELSQAEGLTRQHHRAAVYRWHEDGWQELPTLRSGAYTPASGHGPTFNPTGMHIVSASSGIAEAAVNGITVEKSQRSAQDTPWFWLRGDTYPHRETLKRWGGRWSRRQKAWYFIAAELPDAIQQLIEQANASDDDETMSEDDHEPCSLEEASAVLGVPVYKEAPANEPEGETETPPIRIIKPVLDGAESDAVTTAIRQTKADALPVITSSAVSNGRRNLTRIPQTPCGELTGSITGSVWCYGYAVHDGVCVYVNFGGPRMAVEAIRARFSKGEIVNCVPWDAPGVELTAGEGNTGMYTAYLQNIPEAKFTSVILCHEQVTQPNYAGKSTTFIFHVSDELAMVQLRHHVTKLVKVPVFPEWTGYLWQAGQSAMLVRKTRGAGGLDVLAVDLDVDAWTRLITGGLAEEIISISGNT